jgi:hypothetical protein
MTNWIENYTLHSTQLHNSSYLKPPTDKPSTTENARINRIFCNNWITLPTEDSMLYIYATATIIVVLQGLGLLACSGSQSIFWMYRTVGRTPWTGNQPEARPLPTHRTPQHRKKQTHIHASSGIWNHNPSVWVAKDSMCLTPLSHWDQLSTYMHEGISRSFQTES